MSKFIYTDLSADCPAGKSILKGGEIFVGLVESYQFYTLDELFEHYKMKVYMYNMVDFGNLLILEASPAYSLPTTETYSFKIEKIIAHIWPGQEVVNPTIEMIRAECNKRKIQ
tara:strand:+ start:1136 stop:1474 length:339 start_codon:yes stop_codon:yes gene_type:complete